MGILIENGLIPAWEVTLIALASEFSFLNVLDPTALIFAKKEPSLL